MPFVTKVQPKKQALAGAMRIIPEGSSGAWWVASDVFCAGRGGTDLSISQARRRHEQLRTRVWLPEPLDVRRPIRPCGEPVCGRQRWRTDALRVHCNEQRVLAGYIPCQGIYLRELSGAASVPRRRLEQGIRRGERSHHLRCQRPESATDVSHGDFHG